MRKIVKSSFPICSFTNTPQSYVLFYNLQNFSQKITQKFTNHTFRPSDTVSGTLIFTPCMVNLT